MHQVQEFRQPVLRDLRWIAVISGVDDPTFCSREVTERLEEIVSARDEALYP